MFWFKPFLLGVAVFYLKIIQLLCNYLLLIIYICNSDNENILKSLSTVAVDWLFLI